MYEFTKSPGRLTQQVSKLLGEKLEKRFKQKQYNVSAPQWPIIAFLKKFGQASQKDIGEYLQIDKVSVNRYIDHLEKSGWVKRLPSQTDRRSNIISLSAEGLELYFRLAKEAEIVIEMALHNFQPHEREQLYFLLEKIHHNLKKQ
ncbi:MAG: MarR family winged helix-turn-helix transcriptional regulator [Bacteroidota bacterium]